MNSNDHPLVLVERGMKCGCGKLAVCAHVKSDEAVLSCEDHEYDDVTARLISLCNGWRKISIDEFTVHAVMNS